MFYLARVQDRLRLPAKDFAMNLETALLNIAREKYERTIDKDNTIVLSVSNLKPISDGLIIPGDDAAYYDVEFDALIFRIYVNEFVYSYVTDLVEFGAFISLGPLEGLVHLSQITNDFLTYNKKSNSLVGKDSKISLKKGDFVYAKISTISLKGTIAEAKIGLTMRPNGLGKIEWIQKQIEKQSQQEEKKSKKKEESKK